MANHNPKEYLKEYRFEPLGKEALSRKPICMKLPKDLDAIVRSQPNRNQWLIQAVAEKIARDGLDNR